MTQPAAEPPLLEFRAGLLKRDGNVVVPDPRKGLLRLTLGEEGLTHVQWYERSDAGPVILPEIDIIVLPEEATFSKIPNQRAMALKFPQEKDRNLLFWSQEPDASEDEATVAAVQAVLDGLAGEPSMDMDVLVTERAATERGATSGAPGAGSELLQGPTGAVLPAGPAQYPRDTTEAPADLASMLSSALAAAVQQQQQQQQGASHHRSGPNPEAVAASLIAGLAAARAQQAAAVGPPLDEVLKPEVMLPLLQDPQAAARLSQYLPEEHRSKPDQLVAVAHSPQFQQQLQAFSRALQTGQLNLAQFGLDAKGFSVADFLAAVQEMVDKEKAGQVPTHPISEPGSSGDTMQE